MIWMTLGCELRAVVDMIDSRSGAQSFRCHEQLRLMNDMNDSRS